MTPIQVFIGYDRQEIVAYHAMCQSIIEHASVPVSFTPLVLQNLGSVFNRPMNQLQSTEFAFTRFLVPYLSGYKGWSMFADCDMIMREDIAELWALRDERYAVMCCQHDYTPVEDTKFLGHAQTKYAKKNWSSVMLFNNERCRALSPDYVNTRSGLELHQFKWLDSDEQIGALPVQWNFLVGVYPHRDDAALVHYTQGGPYFEQYAGCDFAQAWFEARDRMNFVGEK
jgi:hypothetical protein